MLKQVTAPKTSALKNLESMFANYPVVTSESTSLKLDVIGEIKESDEIVDGLNQDQQLFSRMMTSINPFSQYIILELVNANEQDDSKTWEIEQNMLMQPKNANQEQKKYSSSAIFSAYNYSKDPMMKVKSDYYTKGEWKTVVDLVNLDQNLLVSSQIGNAVMAIQQREKMMKQKAEEAKQA